MCHWKSLIMCHCSMDVGERLGTSDSIGAGDPVVARVPVGAGEPMDARYAPGAGVLLPWVLRFPWAIAPWAVARWAKRGGPLRGATVSMQNAVRAWQRCEKNPAGQLARSACEKSYHEAGDFAGLRKNPAGHPGTAKNPAEVGIGFFALRKIRPPDFSS